MPALGDRFRSAREARGLSLSDVSEQIRIRSIYLAAIEEENWSAVGAPVYIRGFLRTYARFLGLDPEELVSVFNGEIPAASPAASSAAAAPSAPRTEGTRFAEPARPRPSAPYLVWIAGLIAVLLVGFVVYNEVTMHRDTPVVAMTSAPSVAPSDFPSKAPLPGAAGLPGTLALAGPSPSPCPTPTTAAGSSAAPSPSPCPSPPLTADQIAGLGPQSMALVLVAPSWLRVTVDGSVSMEGTFPAGTSKAFHGKAATIRVGNAGGVQIYVDGKDVGKLGKSGDVIDRSFTL
jgi:cytoskeleton protein RodZ